MADTKTGLGELASPRTATGRRFPVWPPGDERLAYPSGGAQLLTEPAAGSSPQFVAEARNADWARLPPPPLAPASPYRRREAGR